MNSMDDQGSLSDDQKKQTSGLDDKPQADLGSDPSLPPLVKPKKEEEKKEPPSFPKKDIEEVLAELEKEAQVDVPGTKERKTAFSPPVLPSREAEEKEEIEKQKPTDSIVASNSDNLRPIPPSPSSPPLEPKDEGNGEKPKGGKGKKLGSLLVLALILLSLPAGLILVRQSQDTRRSAECNPDPDKCWTITSQSSKEGCEAWCSTEEEYEDTCSSHKVLNDLCEEVDCWTCKKKETPTPVPGECQSENVSMRTQEGCENWCSCGGGDIHNKYEDTCIQSSDGCWYCQERPEPLDDCCSCWSECEGLICPEGLSCELVEGTKRCVNLECPADQDCSCDEEPTPTPEPSVTATPTPGPSISCEYCHLYNEDWEVIDLGSSVFSIGQNLYLATLGVTDEAQGITKARFRVNIDGQTGGWKESTQKKGDEYYLPYAITQGGAYEVEAMIYNPTLGWH